MYPVRSTPLTPLLLTCFCLGLFLSLVEHAFADEPNRVRLDGIEFNLQPGLTLERAVPKSLVKWPVVVDWDCDGRLVVVEAGGAFKPIVNSNKKLLDKIVRLEDTDGDGIFDKRILAADKLPFTEGVLCLGKSILAAAPPYIWKLTDNDGDGLCEEREIWFDGQTITGCANDLHGPHLGIDGWIYWCKGAKAEQTHELTDGSQLKDRAAHIFRRRIEGGPIESVMSGGMENLVEVAFTSTGDRFFSATFVQLPANGKRDGIGHALYGSVHGRKHAVVSPKEILRTGPLMPVMTHLGPAAPSGLICLSAATQSLLPHSNKTDSSVLVTAQFNLHRVSAHRLEPNGAGYRASNHLLMEGDQVDFHPTDILEDESEGLLIVDTGGWYDLCCPTSRGDQTVANGGIYRLRRSDTGEKDLNRTPKSLQPTSIDWHGVAPLPCVELLFDPRPWIRTRAVLRIRELGDLAVPEIVAALSGKQDLASRLDLIWALSHIGSDAALTIVHDVLSDRSKHLDQRLAACHILGLYRFAPAVSTLQGLCGNLDIRLVRAAVEALGRIKNPDSTEILMQVAGRTKSDAALRHTLIYALIEIGDKQKLQNYLGNKNSAATRAIALVALNALNDSTISSFALNAIHSDQPLLINTAVEILKQHPDWSPQAGKHFARLSEAALSTTATSKAGMKSNELAQDILKNLFRAWQSQPATRAFVAKQLLRDELSLEYKLELLDAWKGLELPRVFDQPLSRLLSRDADLVGRRLSSFKLSSKKNQRLVASIKNELDNLEAGSYSKAGVFLTALPSDSGYSNDQIQTYLLRNDFYSLLSKTQIDKSIGQKILQRLVSVSPTDLPDAVTTIIGAKQDELDLQLMEHLSMLPAAKMLDIGLLPSLYRDRSDPLRQAAAELEEKLHSAPDDVAAEVRAKLASLPKGDAVRGLKIFRGSKANCVACHKLGHVGGEHGPELTKIGNTRTREALLESILFPNVRIEQGFRPLKILTIDGLVFNGLATREAGIVHLQTNGEKRISIPEDEIEQQQPGEVSIMPTGMLEQLTNQELADLLAVLKSAK
ncbi:HEAT repeat domain-containing protein [Mariniblastus sp.]|nr:HEAT repeat domain-containing protein [Mariniblastus sp.]